jgi:tetratricopeptide (TPR) repeat protein
VRNALATLFVRYANAARAARPGTAAGARALRWAEAMAPRSAAVILARAERDVAQGDVDAACKRLAELLVSSPGDLEAAVALARALHHRGRTDEAIRSLAGAVDRSAAAGERAVHAHMELAVLTGAAGRFDEAARQAAEALRHRPEDSDLRGYYGYILHKKGSLAEARRELAAATESNTASERVFAWHARVLLETGDRGAAAETLRKGIERHPRSSRLLGDYARFLAEQGAAAEAVESLKKSLAIDPADPLTLATLGSLLTRGDQTEGETYYRFALAIDPAHEESVAGMLKLYDRERRYEDAIRIAESASDHPGASARVLCLCAARLAEANRHGAARRALARAASTSPEDAAVALSYADILLYFNELREAEHWYSEALRFGGHDPRVLARVAGWHLESGRLPDAESLAKRALELDPRCVEALGIRSGLLAFRNRFEEALAVRREAIQLDPDSAAGHIDAANLLAQLGRAEDATIELQIASRLNPTGRLLVDYSIVLLAQNRVAHAFDAMEPVVREGRGGPRAGFVYAHVLAAMGRRDESRLHLAAALESGTRAELDVPRLKEARDKVVSRVDREFCETIER